MRTGKTETTAINKLIPCIAVRSGDVNAVDKEHMKTKKNNAADKSPDAQKAEEHKLAQWIATQKKAYKQGLLSPEQINDLEMFPGWEW